MLSLDGHPAVALFWRKLGSLGLCYLLHHVVLDLNKLTARDFKLDQDDGHMPAFPAVGVWTLVATSWVSQEPTTINNREFYRVVSSSLQLVSPFSLLSHTLLPLIQLYASFLFVLAASPHKEVITYITFGFIGPVRPQISQLCSPPFG